MTLGRVIGYKQIGNTVFVQTEQKEVRLRFIDERIVNVFVSVAHVVQESKAIENLIEKAVKVTIEESDCLRISTSALVVEVRSPFALTFTDIDGRVINEDYADKGISIGESLGVYKKLDPEEHFYGFGEKTGFLDKAGEEMVMWCSDIPEPHVPSMKALYKSIPFFIGLKRGKAYGIFFDNTYKTTFDMGKGSQEYYSFTAAGGNIDYYFIHGPKMKDVLERYTALTGRMELPPLWALGYQQSRWGYYPESKVMEIAETMRAKEIPCDVLYLDIDYMDGYRVFTWDDERFTAPERMMKQLREQGFKIVPIVDPGVKKDSEYPIYQELLENRYYVTDADGVPFVGKVWPGECLFPDFTDAAVRKWWGTKHSALLDAGVAGIWNDMNEPAVFTEGERTPDEYKTMPLTNLHKNDGRPATHAEMHNVYGLMMSKATYEGLRSLRTERPFIVTRAAYAGIQKYAAVWTGDNQSFWDHLGMALPMCMNLGLSGVAFAGTDVGGFGADCTGELLSRWVQVGAFTPFFRNHSATFTRPQEPWTFDQITEEINRKYIEMRYRFLPYTYNLFLEASRFGLPVMRPLVLEYPDDSQVYRIYDQIMYGENLLIAPVLTPGTEYRHVYLPEGEWVDYWTGEIYRGKQHILAYAPLDTLPIYVKKGSILPNYELMQYVGEKDLNSLILDLYPGNGMYDWYEDDGVSYGYQEDQYNLTRLTLKETEVDVTLTIDELAWGYARGAREMKLQFRGMRGSVFVDGREIAAEYHNDRLMVNITRGDVRVVQVRK